MNPELSCYKLCRLFMDRLVCVFTVGTNMDFLY